MFKFDVRLWDFRVRKLIVMALAVPLLSVMPQAQVANAVVTSVSAPQSVTAVSSPGTITVGWAQPAQGAGSVTGYRVQYSADGSSWTTAATALSSSTFSYAISTGLTVNTAYYFRVAATFSTASVSPDGYPWTALYEVTNKTRNSNVTRGIDYTSGLGLASQGGQAANSLASASFTRVRYRMQYNDGTGLKYVNTDFNKWAQKTNNQYDLSGTYTTPAASIAYLSVPAPDNQFIVQTDVTDLTIESSETSMNNHNVNGRLEIWPFDYGYTLNSTLTGGSGTVYDINDRPSSNTGSSYGSFQVHDLTNTRTVLAWNNHGSSSPDIGIGNSASCNGTGNDWTFCGGTRTNFKLETFINTPVTFTAPQLTFNSNNATTGSVPASIINNGNVTIPGNTGSLLRTGFTFTGWNTAANGKGTRYTAGNTFNLSTNTTLYAQWNSNIQYNGNTATSTRTIESTTALSSAADTTLSNGKLATGAVVSNGLVFNLNASDPTSISGTTWFDVNRNGVTGTIAGSPTYNSQEGYLQLNGSSQYVNLGSSVLPMGGKNNYSASVMFKSDKPSEDNDSIMGRYHLTNGGPLIIRNYAHSKIYAWRIADLISANKYEEGEVNYVTVTYNGTTWKVYINGIIQGSVTSGSASTATADLLLGALGYSTSVGHFWAGRIYSAQGYSRALTDAEVLQNYQALRPDQKATKTNFTLAPWNAASNGTGTSYGTVVKDIEALPTPYLRIQAANYVKETKTWTATNGSGAGFTYTSAAPDFNASSGGRFGATASFPTISGTTNQGIYLNNPTLTAYTLCVVARYKGQALAPATAGSQGRLISTTNINSFYGFHGSLVNRFYHAGAWNYQGTTTDLNWHYFCDAGNKAYWDGSKTPSWTYTAGTTLGAVAINRPDQSSTETSDWELAELIIYDQFLPDVQIEQVNRYFKNTYGITGGSTTTPSVVSVAPFTNYASGGDTTLNATWGSAITYDGNKQTGGSAPSPSLITGTSGPLASNSGSLTKTGWRFDGWNTNESGTGTTYPAGATYLNSGNITLYAKWTLPISFPTPSIEPNNLAPYMRYKASDYDETNKIWRDSSGNGRNTSLVIGTPVLVNTTANTNGSNKTIRVLQGTTADGIKFENPTTTTGKYTLFSLVRYNSANTAKQERILNSLDDLWFTGHHGDKAGVSYHEGTWLKSVSTVTPVLNWVMGTDYPSNYRSNGISQVTSGGGANIRTLSINGASEKSDFQVAEIILYDKILSLTEIRQVEDYLASTYGLIGYTSSMTYITNTTLPIGLGVGGRSERFSSINGFGNKTFSVSPTISGITIDTSTANSVALVVGSGVAAGTYIETITATDELGYTAQHVVTIVVSSNAKFDDATPSVLVTTSGRATSLRLNAVNGIGTKVFTIAQTGGPSTTKVTLDSSTASSNYVTLKVDTYTVPGTYTFAVTVTDDTKLRVTQTITLTINSPPLVQSLSAPSVSPVLSDLRVNLDAGNPLSYSGSGNTWTDLSGNGRNGTLISSPPFITSNGGTLDFDGSADYVTFPSVRSEVFTVEAWVKFDALNTNYACVVTNQYSGNKINYSVCFRGSNTIKAAYHQSGTGWIGGQTGGFTPVVGRWYQIVYKVEKVGADYIGSLYQNGILVPGQTTSTIAPGNDNLVDRIGRRWDEGEYINGSIPVVRIYSRALSDIEITQNYNALSPRFLNSPSNGVTINTTQGVAKSSSIYYAGLGTGVKTFSISPSAAGITIDTSTANSVRLNVSSLAEATNATTARTVTQTITAYDAAGQVAATPIYVTTVINPPIVITPTIANTVTTTFGISAYDTFTATRGAGGPYSFTVTSSANQSAFTMSKPSANVGLLTIANNLPAGTYYETITATDSLTASTSYLLTVIVNPGMTLTGATANSVATTIGKATSLRVNIANGTGAKTLTISSPAAGITLDSSTVGDGYVTIRVGTGVPVNTYSVTLNIRDSTGATATGTFSVVVNRWPVIANPTISTQGLRLNLDGSTYSGSGQWLDSSGNNLNATLGSASSTPTGAAPAFVSDSGGYFDFSPTVTNHIQAPTVGAMETFTVSTWVRMSTTTHSGNPGIVSENGGASSNVNYLIQAISGKIAVNYRVGSTWAMATEPSFTPDLNTWMYVTYVVVKNGTNSYSNLLYKNGVLQDTKSSTAVPSSSSNAVLIGRRWDTTASVFSGDIGGVSIYNRSLTAAEILQNYVAQASRFMSTNSGTASIATTQGVATSVSNVPVSQGTGNKTIALTGKNPAITLNTATANQYTMTLTESLTATNSTTARTIDETVTATDSVTAATTLAYTITVNPPVQLAVTTNTLTTTSGIAAYDTFTATYGTGNKTFAFTGTPTTTGFSVTQSNNVAVLKVEPTINPGTYYETITATDSVGATRAQGVTVVVNPRPTITGVDTLTATAGYVFNSPAYSASGGTGNLTYSITAASGISLVQNIDAVSIRMAETVTAGTYSVVVRVTDSLTAFTTRNVILVVNQPVTLSGNKTLTKIYGEDLAQVYQTSSGTAPFSIFTSSVCTSEIFTFTGDGNNGTINGLSYTAERFNGVGNCNWKVPNGVNSVSALTVGGGGGGGGTAWAGGGGAGGVVYVPTYSVTPNQTLAVVVGAGGAGGLNDNSCSNGNSPSVGSNGSSSSIGGTYVANGGGGGGGYGWDNRTGCGSGRNGGSGGGFGETNYTASAFPTQTGISNQGSYAGATSYGNNGGVTTYLSGIQAGSGGGGAGGAGGSTSASSQNHVAGNGGVGIANAITGSSTYYAGGGGGATCAPCSGTPTVGTGGNGGGGTGGNNSTGPASGVDGLGGGGGGSQTGIGAKGGSGTVIVRYVTPAVDSMTTSLTMTTLSTNSPGAVRLNSPKNMQVGTYTQTITVTDANGSTGSTPVTVTLTITKATPTVALSLPGLVSTAQYGNPVLITATASTAGSVLFKNASTNITACTAVSTTAGIATCTWTPTALGETTLKATLTPTDSTNYNNSSEVSFSINVLQADTLTVTASNESFNFTNTAALVTRPFTRSGLVSIDTLTAVSMIYSGTANDGTSYSSSTAPTKAGTYVITPDTTTAGISTISANYKAVSVVTGSLTINRIAPPVVYFAYNSNYNTNVVTYTPTGTYAPYDINRSGTGVRSFTSTTPSVCSVDSVTAVVTPVTAGSCYLVEQVAQDPNYLAATKNRILTINKAARTIALSSSVTTLKYADTATVVTTLSGGSADGTITYSLNSTPGCSFDALGAILTATSGTLACTLNATVAEGTNYLTASTSAALAITMAKADAPLIVIDTLTAVDYVPGQQAQILPTYTVSGFKGSDEADSLTLTYGLVSTAVGSHIYSSTTVPTDAGTYSITPSSLVMSTGLITDYETPNYAASAINFTINRINQAPITFDNVNGEVEVPFTLTARGGSSSGAASFTVVSGATCSIVNGQLRATVAGKCILTVKRAEDRNYYEIVSETITVSVRNFVLTPVFVFGNGITGITLATNTTLTKGPDRCTAGCVPVLISVSPSQAAPGESIILTGTDFTDAIRVIFNGSEDAASITVDSDTQITATLPSGLLTNEDDYIAVETPGGTTFPLYGFTVLPTP